MRRVKFWAIGIISFFTIAAGTILHRFLAVSLCTVLGFNSSACFLGDSSRVNAAVPLGRGDGSAILAQNVDIFRNDGGSSQESQGDIVKPGSDNSSPSNVDIFAPQNSQNQPQPRVNTPRNLNSPSNSPRPVEGAVNRTISFGLPSVKLIRPDTYEFSQISSEGCQVISKIKKNSTQVYQESVQFLPSSVQACGSQPFTARFNPDGTRMELQIAGSPELIITELINDNSVRVSSKNSTAETQLGVFPVQQQAGTESGTEDINNNQANLMNGGAQTQTSSNQPNNPNPIQYDDGGTVYDNDGTQNNLQQSRKCRSGNQQTPQSEEERERQAKIQRACDHGKKKFCPGIGRMSAALSVVESFPVAGQLLKVATSPLQLVSLGCWVMFGGLAPLPIKGNRTNILYNLEQVSRDSLPQTEPLTREFDQYLADWRQKNGLDWCDKNSQSNNENQSNQNGEYCDDKSKFPYPQMTGKPPNPGMQSFTWTPDYRLMATNFKPELLAQNLESEFETYAKNIGHKETQNFLKNTIAQLRIPGIPNVPGIPGGGTGIIKDAVLTQVVGQLGGFIENERPFSTSFKDVYPTVSAPPGGEFRASPANLQVFSQALREANGSPEIELPPGDYEIPGQVFCFKPKSYGPQTGVGYPLAPIKGKQAAPLIALNSRYIAAGIPHQAAQVLSWNIQLGVKYEDMPPTSRAIVDKILPEFKQQLSRSFWEALQAKWGQISRTIPGVPSFDSVIGRLPGEAGQILNTYQQARASLQQYRDNFDQLQNEMVLEGNAPSNSSDFKYPRGIWSKINDRVYARLLPTTFNGPAAMQVRVLDANGNVGQPSRSSSVPQQATPNPVNNRVTQPINSPQNPTQTTPNNVW